MKIYPAFTLIELLIAMTLSSLIMLGMMQMNNSVLRYLENSRAVMNTNRQVCLLFNQMERDFSTAYIPYLAQEEKIATTSRDKQEESTASDKKEDKKQEEKEQDQRKTFFVATVDDHIDGAKIDGKRFDLLKYVSFICTSPFQVYEERRTRLVRVVYQLVADKSNSQPDNKSYQLIRKETFDLFNTQAKADEYQSATSTKMVRSYVVADNIKALYIEYTILEKDLKKDEPEDKKKETGKSHKEIRELTWGNKKETQGIVPQRLSVVLDIWNEHKTDSVRFNTMFLVFSYPTVDPKEQKEQKKEPVKTPEKDAKKDVAKKEEGSGPDKEAGNQLDALAPPPGMMDLMSLFGGGA